MNSDDQQQQQQWANLPKELLETIGKCIDSRVDIIRFRSVCSSWRSSVVASSFDKEIPNLCLNLPKPINTAAFLSRSTICKMEFINHHQELVPSSCSSSYSKSKAWLVRVSESKNGKLELRHPLTTHKIRYSPLGLNLLDIKFVKLSNAFMLKAPLGYYTINGINKVVVFNKDVLAILAIYHEGKLGYWKNGDNEWTVLDDVNSQYDDIIEYKGQFYVVDRVGTVSWIDKSLRIVPYSPPLFGCGGQKNLVESCGDLYVVDRYLDGERRTWKDDFSTRTAIKRRRRFRKYNPKATDFRVHKLDEEWGTWVDVKSLDDRAFVLGFDCSYSISSSEFVGGKGNCIYFSDDDEYVGRELSGDGFRVFQLEDRSIENVSILPEFCEIFWPPSLGST